MAKSKKRRAASGAKSAASGVKSARDAANTAASNPYLKRLIEDEDLREEIRDSIDHAQSAVDRFRSARNPVDTIIDDKKLHKDLKAAAEGLRDASEKIRGKRRRSRFGRLVLIAAVGGLLAVALSEDLRKAILDKLFGAEEEFEYTSTTAPVANGTGNPSQAGTPAASS
ncbi:hypothetical protein HJD18_13110 [Thermoleophilia bacterium SCSIO 60948]|nr:hypothetical protein HJD18_13110 [Thermoleophilia bacterium SCSIO 60948]